MSRSAEDIRKDIHRLIEEYFALPASEDPATKRLTLVAAAYGSEEVNECVDALLSTYVTMGARVREFEKRFAERVGSKHAVMVNSGSSANLLAMAALANPAFKNHLKPGDEVIVPTVTWSTTVWPVIQMGAVPVLVDVSLETLCMDMDQARAAVTEKTRAIFPVHLLGNATDMNAVRELAKEKKLFVIEDTCEALGTELGGKVVGTFGDFGTYSFYFSHHMTTIEGGMVVTDNDELAELARILRAHGWIRDAQEKSKFESDNPEIDPRFLFVNTGYNLRPTDLNGAFGLHQLGKLDGYNDVRRRNAGVWAERLGKYADLIDVTYPEKDCRHTWFAYPLIVKEGAPFSRQDMVDHLEAAGIETRPIVAGNLAKQPAFQYFPHRVHGNLANAQAIMERGLFFGNHGIMNPVECDRIGAALESFLSRHAKD